MTRSNTPKIAGVRIQLVGMPAAHIFLPFLYCRSRRAQPSWLGEAGACGVDGGVGSRMPGRENYAAMSRRGCGQVVDHPRQRRCGWLLQHDVLARRQRLARDGVWRTCGGGGNIATASRSGMAGESSRGGCQLDNTPRRAGAGSPRRRGGDRRSSRSPAGAGPARSCRRRLWRFRRAHGGGPMDGDRTPTARGKQGGGGSPTSRGSTRRPAAHPSPQGRANESGFLGPHRAGNPFNRACWPGQPACSDQGSWHLFFQLGDEPCCRLRRHPVAGPRRRSRVAGARP